MALTVPPLRERLGYKPAEMVPVSYPGALILYAGANKNVDVMRSS